MRGSAAPVLVLLLASCGGISLEPLEHTVRGEDPGSLDWSIPTDLSPLPLLDSLDPDQLRTLSPFARALLQRDLWMAFDGRYEEVPRPEVRDRLARLLRALALSKEEIRRLPDTYREAAGRFPSRFEASRPFLPNDLFEPEGPWVLLGGDYAVASTHRSFAHERSAFLVFLRHPEGRAAGVALVEGLQSNRLPELPTGADFVLVRRTLLLSTEGRVLPSPITESVEIRHYRGSGREEQSVGKFELKRSELRLVPLAPSEGKPSTAVSFEHRGSLVSNRVPVLATCMNCHGLPGAYGVGSFSVRSSMGLLKDLRVGRVEDQESHSIRAKMKDESWPALEASWSRLK